MMILYSDLMVEIIWDKHVNPPPVHFDCDFTIICLEFYCTPYQPLPWFGLIVLKTNTEVTYVCI
jgi:hypothetical protein